MRNFSASEQLFICRAQCYQRLTKFKHALDNLKKAKSELEEVYKATVHRTKRLCKDDAEGDVAKGVDKHVDCTSKTRTVIGRFPIARTVSGSDWSNKGKECGSKESSRLWGGALRDEPNNRCEGDYKGHPLTYY